MEEQHLQRLCGGREFEKLKDWSSGNSGERSGVKPELGAEASCAMLRSCFYPKNK